MQQQNTAGVHLPLVNEIAAVTIGCGLVHPDADPSFKAAVEKNVAALDASDSKVSLAYVQNTPGELNIVVPDFPEIDEAIGQMSEEDLAHVAGGELFIAGLIAFALGSIGATIGIGSVSLAVGVGASLSAVIAGAVIVGGTVGAGIAGIGTAIGLGVKTGHTGSEGGAGILTNVNICT
ncbi:MAG: hypothetical protein OXU34_04725 [Gammaproteobacteria bacterium]|nr:hypothetical protein [Gammaproteobacteria bacterium]